MPTTTPQPELPGVPEWFKGLMEQFEVRSDQDGDVYVTCLMPNRCPWDSPSAHCAPTLLALMEEVFGHAVTHMQRHHQDMEALNAAFDATA